MTVSELRSLLYYMPQDAKVNVHGGYDPHYGNFYNYVTELQQERVGWDDVNDKPIVEVFIL
ncbi:hypothetical protein [Pseudomonas phage vB_PsaM_M1]|nr:hypothetical protein [Pseudomonas phage vB_PsaM_M1]